MEIGLMAKIGAGVAGAAGVGVGGCYAAGVFGGGGSGTGAPSGETRHNQASKPKLKVLDRTDWSVLALEKNNYEDDSIGKVYGRYLYAPYATGENKTKHLEAWNFKFGHFNSIKGEGTLQAPFKSFEVTKDYQDKNAADEKGLNQLCEEVYKKKVSEVEMSRSNKTDKQKLAEQVMSFCSPVGNMPATITGSTFGENTIGRAKASILINVEGTEKGFWEAQGK